MEEDPAPFGNIFDEEMELSREEQAYAILHYLPTPEDGKTIQGRSKGQGRKQNKVETVLSIREVGWDGGTQPLKIEEIIALQKKDIALTILRTWIENKDRGKTKWNRAPKKRVSYWSNFFYRKLQIIINIWFTSINFINTHHHIEHQYNVIYLYRNLVAKKKLIYLDRGTKFEKIDNNLWTPKTSVAAS